MRCVVSSGNVERGNAKHGILSRGSVLHCMVAIRQAARAKDRKGSGLYRGMIILGLLLKGGAARCKARDFVEAMLGVAKHEKATYGEAKQRQGNFEVPLSRRWLGLIGLCVDR